MITYRNPGIIEFDAVLSAENMILFPYDVAELYGVKGRVPVVVHFDKIYYQGSMVRMNTPTHCLLIRNDIRKLIHKPDGATIHITVKLDDAPRTIEIPSDLASALAEAGLEEAFDKLAFSHRREHINAILAAKRPDTRTKRILDALAMIRSKHNS